MTTDKEEKYKIYFRDGAKEFDIAFLYVWSRPTLSHISVEYFSETRQLLQMDIGRYTPNINFDITYVLGIIGIDNRLRPFIKRSVGRLQMNPVLKWTFEKL